MASPRAAVRVLVALAAVRSVGAEVLLAYKHTSKSGGTYLNNVLSRTFGSNFVPYPERDVAMNRSASLYLIGSVRNPCDWLVSFWGYGWRQSCQRMYTQPRCALLDPKQPDPNFADTRYWERPGACVNQRLVERCSSQFLRSCISKWATRSLGPPRSHFDWRRAEKQFVTELTDGGKTMDPAKMVATCPESGPRPWMTSVDDFQDWAAMNAPYEANIMKPFFHQATARRGRCPARPHGAITRAVTL